MAHKNLLSATVVAVFAAGLIPAASHAAELAGTYGIARMVAGFPGSAESVVLAGRGSITFNSDLSCSATLQDTGYRLNLTSGASTIHSVSYDISCSYAVESNGLLSVTFAGETIPYQGNVSADGSSFNLAGPDADGVGKVRMLLGHRRGDGLGAAALSGSYRVGRISAGFPTSAEMGVARGEGSITFNGSGGCSADVVDVSSVMNRSTGGTESTETRKIPTSCGYSVASDGGITLKMTNNQQAFVYQGTVSADGASLTLAGSDPERRNSVTLVSGARPNTGQGRPPFIGSYGITRAMLGFSGGTESVVSAGRGAITFEGGGICRASFLDTKYALGLASGTISDHSAPVNIPCSYLLTGAYESSLIVDFENLRYSGSLSADGSSFTLTGSETGNNGKVMLLTGERLGSAYAYPDVAGQWMSAGIETPLEERRDLGKSGYDIERTVIYVDGSGSKETVATSDVSGAERFPAGSVSISGAGNISTGDSSEVLAMSARKNVMFTLKTNPLAGEQQLFISLKQAYEYRPNDLIGYWMGVGLKTPAKLNSDPDNFGFDVEKMVISSAVVKTTISSSDSPAGSVEILPEGSVSTASDGNFSLGRPGEYIFLNRAHDVMFQFRTNPAAGNQQLFVRVKRGANHTIGDAVGKWVGAVIKTPAKGKTWGTFGHDLVTLTVKSDGSGLMTRSTSSLPIGYLRGTFSMQRDGTLLAGTDTFYMNAGRDVMVQLKTDPLKGDQQLLIYLKEATTPDFTVHPVKGSCGSASGMICTIYPDAGLCSSGYGTGPVADGLMWRWTCMGVNGGSSMDCSAYRGSAKLAVTVTGNGTVISIPSGVSCSSDSTSGCSAIFGGGSSVRLFAVPSAGSLFDGWSGSLSGISKEGVVDMNGDEAITAAFSPMPGVTVGSKAFSTLQAAYDDEGTVDGSVIKLLKGFLPGSFTAWKNITVKVEGDYNVSTSVQGPFIVKSGKVVVQTITTQ